MTPAIDLVAVSYGAKKETERFLASVIAHVEVPFTLTVIDNNSPDRSVPLVVADWIRIIRESSYCVSAQLVRLNENTGYARACNLGSLLGSAPVLALLNCDIEFRSNVVADILAAFDQDPTVGIVGPKTVDRQNRLTHSGIVFNGANDTHRAWLADDHGQCDDVLDVPTVSGATYFVRRTCWEELSTCPTYLEMAPGAQGAFLPTPHYFEETWCSYHAAAHDWRVIYLGTTSMIHEWHKSSPIGGRQTSIWFKESQAYFRRAAAVHGIELLW